MQLARVVEDEIRFLEIAMAEAFVVELREQPRERAGRLLCVALPLAEMLRAGNFLHQKKTARHEDPARAFIRRRDRPRAGHAREFEVICLVEPTPPLRGTEQVLEQIAELAKVVALEHESVTAPHSRTAARLQNLRAPRKKAIGITQHGLHRRRQQRQPDAPHQFAKTPRGEFRVALQAAARAALKKLAADFRAATERALGAFTGPAVSGKEIVAQRQQHVRERQILEALHFAQGLFDDRVMHVHPAQFKRVFADEDVRGEIKLRDAPVMHLADERPERALHVSGFAPRKFEQ